MGQIGLWQLIIVVLFFAIFVWPVVRILHRAGRSGWWAVLVVVPLLNIVMFWVFAFAHWPKIDPPAVDPNALT